MGAGRRLFGGGCVVARNSVPASARLTGGQYTRREHAKRKSRKLSWPFRRRRRAAAAEKQFSD